MKGLKLQVKINNNDELKQAHDLLLCIGYSTYNEDSLSVWASQGKPIWLKTNCSRENKDKIDWSFFSTEVGFKEITLLELRAMVHQDQDEPFLTPECTLNDQYAEIEEVRQHSHYFKDVSSLNEIDVYMVLKLFNVTDPCLQHIAKKALCAGQRGHKDFKKDLQDILDTAKRAVEINN